MISWKQKLVVKAIVLIGRKGNLHSIRILESISTKLFAREPEVLLQLYLNISKSQDWAVRYFVGRNLPIYHHLGKEQVTLAIKELAEDSEPMVRDGVLWGISRLLELGIEENYTFLLELLQDPSPLVRRLAPFALGPFLKRGQLTVVEKQLCFQVIREALANPHPQGSKQLGSHIIGKFMTNSYPEETIKVIKEGAKSPNSLTRWHVARALSGNLKQYYPEITFGILVRLTKDSDCKVRKLSQEMKKSYFPIDLAEY